MARAASAAWPPVWTRTSPKPRPKRCSKNCLSPGSILCPAPLCATSAARLTAAARRAAPFAHHLRALLLPLLFFVEEVPRRGGRVTLGARAVDCRAAAGRSGRRGGGGRCVRVEDLPGDAVGLQLRGVRGLADAQLRLYESPRAAVAEARRKVVWAGGRERGRPRLRR